MSTHCAIFYKDHEGKCNGIFCHFNGMPDTTGDILYHHYQNEALVQQLIDLGGLLFIEEDIRDIVTFRAALNHKMIDKKSQSEGYQALTEMERKKLCHYELAKAWHPYQTKWSFSNEDKMLEAYHHWDKTEFFFGSQYIYLYDTTKKGKNKWTIFYHGKTTLCHRNLTPSLIKKLSD